jgi:hypothetical protein
MNRAMSMRELAEFVLACIAADESDARQTIEDVRRLGNDVQVEVEPAPFEDHLIRWLPERALAECEAKKRRVRLLLELLIASAPVTTEPAGPDDQVMTLVLRTAAQLLKLETLPYVNQPGFREEWRPM